MTEQLTMEQERDEVKRCWKFVRTWIKDLDSYGTDQFIIAFFYNARDAKWCDNSFKQWESNYDNEDEAIHAAWLYTEERKKELAVIRRAVEFVISADPILMKPHLLYTYNLLIQNEIELRKGWKG
jgi:hypothetical protein